MADLFWLEIEGRGSKPLATFEDVEAEAARRMEAGAPPASIYLVDGGAFVRNAVTRDLIAPREAVQLVERSQLPDTVKLAVRRALEQDTKAAALFGLAIERGAA